MKQKLVHYSIAFFLLITIWKCATITTPQGGPKDEVPPKLLKSNPAANQKNFKEESLELTFDEPIKLKDARQQILITPSPGKETSFTAKGNVLTIKPKSPWLDSTTYSISFREGVQDLSEGNSVPNLRLAFSTGPTLDSLTISGTIKDAISEKIPDNITVALYSQDTFNIFKHTPSYFTQTAKDGIFKIENLKPDNYSIYAFDDKNKNLKVDSPAETFGFLSDTIYLIKNVDALSISLLKIDTRELKLTSARSIQDVASIKFNKAITNYKIEAKDSLYLQNSFGDDQTQIAVYLNSKVRDSVQVHIYAQDSLLQKIDTALYLKRTATKRQPDPLKISFKDLELDSLAGEFRASFQSNKIINYFNYDSINLRLDSAKVIRLEKNDISFDSIFKTGYILKKIDRSLLTSQKKKYKLELGKDYACSNENDSIKSQKMSPKLLTFEETGTLSIDLKNNTSYDLIVELTTPSGKLVRSITNPKKYTFQYLIPETYKIRVIHDRNRNGKWDYGNPLLREEPEDITFYMTQEKKYSFPIRANWEVGPFPIVIDKPLGKPKDEKPPKLITSSPTQNQINFKEELIQLNFDEPVKLNNPKDQIVVNPPIGKNSDISTNGKSVYFRPINNWKENTTYIISFREAIQDTRGGNSAQDLKLIFSTDNFIDSLSISGTTSYSLSAKSPENIIVALYSSDTFNIFKHRPLLFTKVDKRGNFKINHIKPGKYYIYTFEDKNKNLIVESQKEEYGFLTSQITAERSINNLALQLYKIDSRKPLVTQSKSVEDLVNIQLNKKLNSYSLTNKNNIKLETSFGNDRSQILVYLNSKVKDSIKIQLRSIDSLNQKIDTSFFIKRTTIKRKKELFAITNPLLEIDSASGEIKAQFNYNKKASQININKIGIAFSNNQVISIDSKELSLDTLSKTINLVKKVEPTTTNFNRKNPPNLIVLPTFLKSIEGDSLKPQKIPFKLNPIRKDGIINVEVSNANNKKFIVDLLNEQNSIVSTFKNESPYSFKNLPKGKYKIRITIDQNNNGKWDYGNIFQHSESEKTFFFITPEKSNTIEIKEKSVGSYKITI